MLVRRILLLLAAVLAAPIARAQLPAAPDAAAVAVPQLDVISVKPDKTNSGMRRIMFTADGINDSSITVHMLLTEAYDLNDDQILAEPAWAKTDNFDVEAKVAGPDVAALSQTDFDQRRALYRQVLADRFQLAVHHETRELRVYVLSVQKGGPKFKESTAHPYYLGTTPNRGSGSVARGKVKMQDSTLQFFVSYLSREVGRTVLDKTGLTGHYDYALTWAADEGAEPSTSPSPADSGPSIFTAIQEQLGLKLESTKGPVPVLVIDHIEKPSDN